jgi:hypothetical protein
MKDLGENILRWSVIITFFFSLRKCPKHVSGASRKDVDFGDFSLECYVNEHVTVSRLFRVAFSCYFFASHSLQLCQYGSPNKS